MLLRVVLIASLPLGILFMGKTNIIQYLRYSSGLRLIAGLSMFTFPRVSTYTLEIGAGWLSNKYIFTLDFYSVSFFMLRYLVLWSILLFSIRYIREEAGLKKFIFFMVLFITFIFCLTSCTNLMFMLLRWERVRILSFLLISWWPRRSEASTSALQAVMYNRVRDFRLYIAILVIFILRGQQEFDFGVYNIIISVRLLIRIIAKSAQFLFHPWLPNAIERPTPVSSLLHSSTIVMARVFLLIRVTDTMSLFMIETVFLIGALTMVYGSICALFQSDMKKTIAYSTTSQLGFIISTLGMRIAILSFIHLCLHAFFKSVIFMSSGYIIHDSANNQDYRRIRKNIINAKIATVSMVMGSLSLAGFPFFAGFASKDLILENLMRRILNRICIILIFFSCILTVRYSTRLILRSLKRVTSSSFLRKLNRREFLRTIRWNMNRSIIFIVSRRVLASFMFVYTGEELVNASGLFSLVLLSLRRFLGISYIKSPRQVRFYLLYYNPLMHNLLVGATQRFIRGVGSVEFRLVESPFLNIERIKNLGGWMKKKYSFVSYLLILRLCGLLLI